MKAVILVGGEGTRLRPLTLQCLKSMVPMANRAFLEYPFYLLRRHGITDIVLSISQMQEKFKKNLGNGRRYGVKLNYAVEQSALGTGGAIKNAESFLTGTDTIVVLNGDILSDLNLTEMAAIHHKKQAELTIALSWVQDPSPYGLVLSTQAGRVQRFVEKPNPEDCRSHWINSGIYIFNRRLLEAIPPGVNYSAERGLFPALLAEGRRVWSYTNRGYWLDIGTPAKYLQAHADILEGRMFQSPPAAGRSARSGASRIHSSAVVQKPLWAGPGCRLESESRIGPLVTLGAGCRVGAHATIDRSVLWDHVDIGEGARISGSIVASGCRVGRHAVLSPGTVLGEGAVIPDYSQV